jgi:hypothetical protein
MGGGGKRVSEEVLYEERVWSNRTEALFLALAAVFGGLAAWRARAGRRRDPRGTEGGRRLRMGLVGGAAFFAFYALNFRTLMIRVTRAGLRLRFGVFEWVVPVEAVEACGVDELPAVLRLGGAGIHFMFVGGRYRVSFNFLEHPRVVVALRGGAGPVRDVSFSTRRPEAVCEAIAAGPAAATSRPQGS